MTQKAKTRAGDLIALALLAGLTLVFFWKIALTNLILTSQDMFAYFYPYRDLTSAALRAGQLPLWNPYLFMGAPLLANSQAAVLYPLHWPLIWLSTPKQLAWSIVIHVWLAGAGTYLFARRATGLQRQASFVAAAVFCLGGFVGAQVEHVNQINASAWLPWLLLCIHATAGQGAETRRQRFLALLGGGAIVGLTLLAGHTQAAYVVLSAAAAYTLWLGLRPFVPRKREARPGDQPPRRPSWRAGLGAVVALAGMVLLGAVLAVGQLLPTLELSRLSTRSGGLPYDAATSFSLNPLLLFKALLPPLLWEPPFTEYVAYVGLLGLGLALAGAWSVLRCRHIGGAALVLALVGLFLALGRYNPLYWLFYKLVPGFALFRAPARWLLLYSFGAALLAGIGIQVLNQRRPWKWTALWGWAVTLLLLAELFLAGRRLPYNLPTAPAAFDSMRTAPAHLLADDSPEPLRFLSMSDIRFDPGDMGDLQAMYAGQLSEKALYDLIVATKVKEVLGFNLPLRYRLHSLDGYDGGLLPIGTYLTLQRLFLPEEDVSPDGRMREQLRKLPPTRLLSPMNVKYAITDKTQDVWIDGVYYDLEHTVPLGQVTLSDLPDFESTHLGVVSYLTGTTTLADGIPVAEIAVTARDGAAVVLPVLAGEHTAEGLYAGRAFAHGQARVGHAWRDNPQGSDYVAALELPGPLWPAQITVRSLLPGEQFRLRGLTLIDDATETSRNLSVDPAYRLAHSGDVKIYENLTVLPRAFVVHRAHVVDDDEAALALLQGAEFDLGVEAILADGQPLDGQGGPAEVTMVTYQPEFIQLQAWLAGSGYLILADTFYPGWVAEVDGEPAPIQRANLYFRAVLLESGEHVVTFRYRPAGLQAALVASLVAWLLLALAFAVATLRSGRKNSSGV